MTQNGIESELARAARELSAAGNALKQSHALFNVIDALLGDEASTYRAQVLVRIGLEMTINYGEWPEEEAANLAEVSHV